MNLGSNILQLRKQKNVTQEELAAELGVTAAAVSKWENGYTLPDILMLCALADFFAVTTDELLGREKEWKYAVIAATTHEFGKKIQKLALGYGISVKAIHTNYADAVAHMEQDGTISFMLISLEKPIAEEELREGRSGVTRVNVNCDTEEQTLEGFALYFKHMDSIQALAENNLSATQHS